jgi:hypothetical protein
MRFAQEYNCEFIDDAASAFNTALIEQAMSLDFEPFFGVAA